MMHIRSKTRGGFTIVEVLLAMMILLFGMTAVLGLLTAATALGRTAELRTVGASASEAIVADLEETLFPEVDGQAGPPRVIKERSVPGHPDLVYSATSEQNPARPLEYKVEIAMRWTSAGIERERHFTTLLLRELAFGERLRRRFIQHAQDKPAPPAAPVQK